MRSPQVTPPQPSPDLGTAEVRTQGQPFLTREPLYRIVCPAVYGSEWPTPEARIGPGTFWTPRSDALLGMVRAVFVHHGETSPTDRESPRWNCQIFRIQSALMRSIENWNPYGRACQQGEQVLVEAVQKPLELLSFHPLHYPTVRERVQLFSSIETVMGEPVTKYIDYSRGERVIFNNTEAFLLDNRENWSVELAVRSGSWRFKVLQRFTDSTSFQQFLDAPEVSLPEDFDNSGRFFYFWKDFAERPPSPPALTSEQSRKRRRLFTTS